MKKAIQFICVLLIVAMLAVPVSAAGFTPSVEQKGAPAAAEKDVTVTALVDLDKAPAEVKKVIEEAHKVIAEAKSVAEAVPAVEIVNAGTYTVEAQFTSADGVTGTKTATVTIAKADYVLENPSQYFAAETSVPYEAGYVIKLIYQHILKPLSKAPKGLRPKGTRSSVSPRWSESS